MGVHLDSIVLNDDLRKYVSATALHIPYKANFGLDTLNVLWVLFLYINLQEDIWFLNKKIVIPPETKFRGGILDSPCLSVRLSVCPSVRPSVGRCPDDNSNSFQWI